jgi:phospholipid/cholesterol/gamma-HCH transport system permease protein
MNFVGRIGAGTIDKWLGLRYVLAVAWTSVTFAFKRRYWTRSVRDVLARQILFTGYEATRFVSLVAALIGIAVVVQTQVLLETIGQSAFLGPVLVTVIIRELAPLLTNFIVIGRSGTAMATEMGNMKVNGEVHVLDAQGLDPFIYLVLPRVLGAAVSVFCLTIVFVVVSFASGFICGTLLGLNTQDLASFSDSVFGAVKKADVLNILAKTLLPGLITGSICCTEGLSVGHTITEVPQAATRAVSRSTAALFILSAAISVLSYL